MFSRPNSESNWVKLPQRFRRKHTYKNSSSWEEEKVCLV